MAQREQRTAAAAGKQGEREQGNQRIRLARVCSATCRLPPLLRFAHPPFQTPPHPFFGGGEEGVLWCCVAVQGHGNEQDPFYYETTECVRLCWVRRKRPRMRRLRERSRGGAFV